MSGGVSRFDCYPSDFLNGVIGLSGDQIAAYTIVMMLQYDRGEAVAYVGRERELSVRSGLPKRRLAVAIAELIRLGKLTMTVAGALQNGRTAKELEKIGERIRKNGENSLNGGETTKKKWERIRKENKEAAQPTGQPDGKPKQGPYSPPSSLPPPPEKEKIIDADASIVDETVAAVTVADEKPEKAALRVALKSFGEAWNDLAGSLNLPAIDEIKPGSARERHALARLREMPAQDGVLALMARIRGSPYLRGEVNGFRCTFDWIVNASNYQKVMEGNYEDRKIAKIHR